MRKKKIAFFVQHMLCGGVENALISLSAKLVEKGYDVTIYVIKNKGDFMKKIPTSVSWSTIPMAERIRESIPVGGTKITIRECIEQHHYINAAKHLVKHMMNRNGFAELNIALDKIPMLDIKYDIAVNFHMHSPYLVWYLSERVKANRKITWIHNDFTTTAYDVLKLKKYLDCCQEFYGVSKRLVEEFVDIIPDYKDKAQVMYNIVPVDSILEKANESAPEFESIPNDYIKILSVGRLEAQKGYEITVEVCKLLKQAGYKVKWIVLGEGTERAALEKAVEDADINQELNFLGVRMNPYPYFKNCNLYVQTSLHEGYVTTITEANIFGLPIVCTDVSGAREQIEDGINGYVTSFKPLEIVEKIQLVLNANMKKCENNVLNELEESEKMNLKIFE